MSLEPWQQSLIDTLNAHPKQVISMPRSSGKSVFTQTNINRIMKDMQTQSRLQEFCKTFNAYTEKSNRKFIKRTNFDPSHYNAMDTYDLKIEHEEGICIHLTEENLERLLDYLGEQSYTEMRMRREHPMVEKLYSKYRMMVNLLKGDYR